MDRDFRIPQDVARAGATQVEQSLTKVLRRGVEGRPFVMRLRFAYDGGSAAPLMFIGSMNRFWSDYINANARANDMVTGVCSTARGEVGRLALNLTPRGGRGTGDGNLLELNRALRKLNVEAFFVTGDEAPVVVAPPSSVPPALAGRMAASAANVTPEPAAVTAAAPDDDPTAAAPSISPSESAPPPESIPASESNPVPESIAASAVEATLEAAPQAPVPPADVVGAGPTTAGLAQGAKAIKQMFDKFKAAPTAQRLDALVSAVGQWQADQAMSSEAADPKVLEFVDKLDALLIAKGQAFVASRTG
jgi:hypothetical protein